MRRQTHWSQSFVRPSAPDAETAGISAVESHLASPDWLAPAVDEGKLAATVAALESALAVLHDSGVETTTDLVARLSDQGLDGSLAQAWASRDALTHRMLTDTAMLSGYLDPEVDQIMVRYVAEAIGTDPDTTPPARVIAALMEVATRFDAKILPLEFAILKFVRG